MVQISDIISHRKYTADAAGAARPTPKLKAERLPSVLPLQILLSFLPSSLAEPSRADRPMVAASLGTKFVKITVPSVVPNAAQVPLDCRN